MLLDDKALDYAFRHAGGSTSRGGSGGGGDGADVSALLSKLNAEIEARRTGHNQQQEQIDANSESIEAQSATVESLADGLEAEIKRATAREDEIDAKFVYITNNMIINDLVI